MQMQKNPRPKDPILREYDGRCRSCYMRDEKCICSLVPDLVNHTKVTVIMHQRESYKTTNTARIACMALRNSEIVLRGVKGAPLEWEWKDDAHLYQPLLLTLADESVTLTTELVKSFNKPIHLIVPDGNWRQANRVRTREKSLKAVPWVKLPPGAPSCYKLRHEHHPEGMSTLEAMARALAIIESPRLEQELMNLFRHMVARTLETRPPNMVDVNEINEVRAGITATP